MSRTFAVFMTPTLSRSMCVEYQLSALATQHVVYSSGIDHIWRAQGGDPYLDKVRNRLVSESLQKYPEATDFFFIDDDEGWPPEAVIRFLARPEDVVAGVYPKKQDNTEFPVEVFFGDDGDFIMRDGLIKAYLVPTGFLRIKRGVLERMAEDAIVFPDPTAEGTYIDCWEIFKTGVVPDKDNPKRGKFWGEDYWFSAQCHQMGIDIWIDPDIVFTHRGQKVWAANFLESVRLTRQKIQESRSAA